MKMNENQLEVRSCKLTIFTTGLLKCYFNGVHIYISIYVIKAGGGWVDGVNDKDVTSMSFFLTVIFKRSGVLDFLKDKSIYTDTETEQHSQHQTCIQPAIKVKQQNERGGICLHFIGDSHCCFLLSWQPDGGFGTLGQ